MRQDTVFIVAGDEMLKLMKRKCPENTAIPFREDLSQGSWTDYSFSEAFIAARASFWNVPISDYLEKMSPIISLDVNKRYILCFGEDACCKANLGFLIGYLRKRDYSLPIQVRIVNEHNLGTVREYIED